MECFSAFHYLFIHVMFATFCVYFVYDFYTNNNNTQYRLLANSTMTQENRACCH